RAWVRSVSVAAHRLPASEPATARADAGEEDKGPRLAGCLATPRSVAGSNVMPFIHGGQTRADPPGEMIMTQDKARKTATRQRMAETGEPYSVARHAVENEAAGAQSAAHDVGGRESR